LENGTICYYKNTSTGSNPTFGIPIANYSDNLGQTISVGQYAAPQLVDLNKDGKLDLVIGNKTGELIYYENIGTSSIPSFELKNSLLGGVDVSSSISPDGYAVPHFFDHQDTTYLMVGSLDGAIHLFDSIQNNLSSGNVFSERTNNLLNLASTIGAYSACSVKDIDNDGNLDLFIGQDLGGVFHLEHDSNSSVGIYENSFEEDDLFIFPNPTNGIFTLQTKNGPLNVTIYGSDGKTLHQFLIIDTYTEIDITALQKGIYFLKTNNSESVYRIMKN
jgi:hypothetical protein